MSSDEFFHQDVPLFGNAPLYKPCPSCKRWALQRPYTTDHAIAGRRYCNWDGKTWICACGCAYIPEKVSK